MNNFYNKNLNTFLKNIDYKKLNFLDLKTKNEISKKLKLLQVETCEDDFISKLIWINLIKNPYIKKFKNWIEISTNSIKDLQIIIMKDWFYYLNSWDSTKLEDYDIICFNLIKQKSLDNFFIYNKDIKNINKNCLI